MKKVLNKKLWSFYYPFGVNNLCESIEMEEEKRMKLEK